PLAKKWLAEIESPIQVTKEGTHKLEVLLLSWEEGEKLGAVIQYDLVDMKTQNLLWELGRTFILKGDEADQGLIAHLNELISPRKKEATNMAAKNSTDTNSQGSTSKDQGASSSSDPTPPAE